MLPLVLITTRNIETFPKSLPSFLLSSELKENSTFSSCSLFCVFLSFGLSEQIEHAFQGHFKRSHNKFNSSYLQMVKSKTQFSLLLIHLRYSLVSNFRNPVNVVGRAPDYCYVGGQGSVLGRTTMYGFKILVGMLLFLFLYLHDCHWRLFSQGGETRITRYSKNLSRNVVVV